MSVETASRMSGIRRVIALTAATIGVIYGYGLGNISGALLFIPKQFGLSIVIYRFPPETKGRQLEAIQEYWENGGVWPEHADRSSRTA